MTSIDNGESCVVPSSNIDVKGVNFTILFLEKLKLFQLFFRKNSVYNKNKQDYWKHEKAILHWAWSSQHQHLARNLTTQRLRQIYGLRVEPKKISETEIDVNWHVANVPDELILSNKDELIKEMFDERGRKLEPIMGNLYMKGLAYVIRYGDILETLSKVGEAEIAKKLQDSTYVVHSIIINFRGLLVGELVDEEKNGMLWKYKLTIMLIYHAVFISVILTALLLCNQLLANPITIGFPDLDLVWWIVLVLILFGWFKYSWDKI